VALLISLRHLVSIRYAITIYSFITSAIISLRRRLFSFADILPYYDFHYYRLIIAITFSHADIIFLSTPPLLLLLIRQRCHTLCLFFAFSLFFTPLR